MNIRNYMRILLTLFALSAMAVDASAQSREVSGIVMDGTLNAPMVGCTVIVQGTTRGTTTGIDGAYSLKVDKPEDVLIFQSLGYDTQEIAVGARTKVDVTLKESATKIDEVVVTALGLTRSEKSLGYAVTKVSNEALTQSVSSNWITNMNGKVAGLSMSGSGSGAGGTQRVTLRGDSSLNYGKNEALFVVDGVPILSGTTATTGNTNYANGDAPVDFGNAVTDINPDDIENVSVLKGPAATALYGSRAGNGAIVITTKSGRKDQGWGVTYNMSVTFENAGWFPDFQNQYGPSAVTTSMTNQYASAWGLPGSMTEDGIPVKKEISRYAFGEKFDASKMRYLYMSKNWENNTFTPLPWVYADDWFTGLFETGVTYTNSVTVDGSSGKGTSARFSFTDSRNNYIMPNTGYNRQTYSVTVNQKINKHIDLSAKINYSRRKSDNMPVSGYDESSPLYGLIWGYNTNPISAYRDEYFQGRYTYENWLAGDNASVDPYNVQSSLIYNSKAGHNPYRTLYEELNTLVRDRVYGNVSVNINILPSLTLTLRGGMDMNNDFRTIQKPKMTADYPEGMFREQTVREFEFNTDFLLKYNKTFFEDRFSVSAAFGGNRMDWNYQNIRIEAPELEIEGPGMFTLANSAVAVTAASTRQRKSVQSLYAFLNLGWDDTYFIDITGRNDWSSTLYRNNWSYFYPSVSASVLLDKAFKIDSKNINMLKLRASWANVGNDTDPYSLLDAYTSSGIPGGYQKPASLKNLTIRPENVESWEVGFESRLFQSRLSFDVALYKNITTDQIIAAAQSYETGTTSMVINAGRVDSKGLEISLRGVPVRTKEWMWEIYGNWSMNRTKLVELTPDWDPSAPFQTPTGSTVGGRTYIYSYIGQEMQQIYGRDYQRAPEGSTYTAADGSVVDCSGQILIDPKTGYPQLAANPDQYIAQVNPDWRAGFGTTVRWKNLAMTASFTAQMGGNAYSVTNFALSYQGKLNNSIPGRQDGLVVEGVNAVTADGKTSYQRNNTITTNVFDYYNGFKWVRDNTYENTFSTDFLKFKELRIDYTLPEKLVRKTGFLRSVAVGLYATNLFCITDWPQFDPEAVGTMNGSQIVGGIETGSLPMTRTYGFNIKLQF